MNEFMKKMIHVIFKEQDNTFFFWGGGGGGGGGGLFNMFNKVC